MGEFIDSRTRVWAAVAVIVGVALSAALDLVEDPDSTVLDVTLHLLEMTPLVLTTVGIVILFQVTRRQRDEHRQLLRDLEIARMPSAGAARRAHISRGWARRLMPNLRAGT